VVVTEPKVSTDAGSRPAEPLGASRSEPPLDPAVVDSLRRLGARSGRDVLRELTDLFLTTADAQAEVARQLLGRFELPELARVAHALKGSASVIGGRQVAAAAAALEATCFAPDGTSSSEESVRVALTRFLDELELLRTAIRELTGS
jgi:HPt (histidine-containing phosphotransfer) domain-containing protein